MSKPLYASPKRYFIAVDGLRLLASINIVLFHLQGIGGLYDLHDKPHWLFALLKGPAFHASIFFMLGGFIFTLKFSSQVATFNNWTFLKKRFNELYPLHAITTLAMLLLKIIHTAGTGDFNLPKILFSGFMHLTFLWSLVPFFSYALNRPSWALSAFFLCYLLFGIALKQITRTNSKRRCMLYAALCLVPLLLWSLLFKTLGTPEQFYPFFHIFAPIRFFEFLLGMVLARFFQLTNRVYLRSLFRSLVNDGIIVATLLLIIGNLTLQTKNNPALSFFSYHLFMVPLYFLLLYGLATEQGFIARLLSTPIVRKTGRSSFYPYLLHIPLISYITYVCEHGFGYYKFLHRPVNIIGFMVLLYGGSYLYVNHVRKRKPSGPGKIKG